MYNHLMKMTSKSQERMLKVVKECPLSKFGAMRTAAEVSMAAGKKEGELLSGDYKGYWRAEAGKAVIFAVTKADEDISDYYESP